LNVAGIVGKIEGGHYFGQTLNLMLFIGVMVGFAVLAQACFDDGKEVYGKGDLNSVQG